MEGDAEPPDSSKDAGKPSNNADSGVKKDGSVQTGCGSCPTGATCSGSGSSATCKCKDGYKLNGKSGSDAACVDIDECADAKLNDCASTATCKNSDGSYTCTCSEPAYTGDGKSCTCALGYKEIKGECKANDAKDCSDDSECVNQHCVSGVCCAEACDAPPACKLAASATCNGGSKCKYDSAPDDSECDDQNPCTGGDKCNAGSCLGDGSMVAAGTKCHDDDMCGEKYRCDGGDPNTCVAKTPTDCTSFNSACTSGNCDPKTGCYALNLDDGGFCVDDMCRQDKACQSGTCSGGTAVSCDDGNPCTNDGVCDTANGGCPQKTPDDNASCDDSDPCTTGDQCANGLCGGSARDCSDNKECTDDTCDRTDTSGDPCRHANDDTNTCSDGKACTANDVCSGGSCIASNGPYSACGVATGCTEGNPITCTCDGTNDVLQGGVCVPAPCTNPSSNPCVAEATCSVDNGNATCSCPPNNVGNGKKTSISGGTGCTACGSNQKVINGACVCDLSGTFALKISESISFPAVFTSGFQTLQAGTDVELDTWAIRTQKYDSSGNNLSIVTVPCGGTTLDICGTAFVGGNAFSQYVPQAIWGTGAAQDVTASSKLAALIPPGGGNFSVANAAPNAAYNEPQYAALIGIHLDDPMGPWPLNLGQIGADSAHPGGTNGAYWANDDSGYDSNLGVSAPAVPPPPAQNPGPYAIRATDPLGPAFDIPRPSSRCATGGNSGEYAYWPDPVTATFSAITKFYEASRVISNLQGTIGADCNTISGHVFGPVGATNGGKTDGTLEQDGRIAGVEFNGSTADCMMGHFCSATTANAIDDSTGLCANTSGSTSKYCRVGGTGICDSGVACNPVQTVSKTKSTFKIKRIPGASTCADVRGATF